MHPNALIDPEPRTGGPVNDVKIFQLGAGKHPPKPKNSKPVPDIPFRLEDDGPIYHMRAEIDATQVSVLGMMFTRAEQRGDVDTAGERTLAMLDKLFDAPTVDALLVRITDPDDPFDQAAFRELIEKVMEHHTARPTTSSQTSSGTRRRSGAKSTASSSSKASTSGRSRSTGK